LYLALQASISANSVWSLPMYLSSSELQNAGPELFGITNLNSRLSRRDTDTTKARGPEGDKQNRTPTLPDPDSTGARLAKRLELLERNPPHVSL
jgi:hypothetical protein